MNDLLVCCVETDPGKERDLKRTANICNIPLHVYGMGKPWEGFLTKTKTFLEELEKVPNEYVMCLDSRDVMIYNATPEKLLDAYLQNYPDKDVIFNGETNCYPNKAYASEYISKAKYRYFNSGCFIGKRTFILEMLEMAMLLSETDTLFPQDDQHLYTTLFLQDQVHGPIGIDEKCMVFQVLWDENGGRSANFDMIYTKDYVYNQETDTYPMVFHYPGHTCHGETLKKVIDGKLNMRRLFD